MSEEATAEVEVEPNPLADLVDAALAKDYNKANEIFGQAISVKLDDVIGQEKINVANTIFNAIEDEEADDEDEDEDMEDSEDLDDDDLDVEDSDDEGDDDDSEDDDLVDEEDAEESV
tara:strand:- start:396 stop:746 length:351 start_codon:yes stop_codon:yes gene_type:complete